MAVYEDMAIMVTLAFPSLQRRDWISGNKFREDYVR